MRAIPIAYTVERLDNMQLVDADWTPPVGAWKAGEALLELSGRLCYLSFKRPNALTAKIEDYLANIRSQGHFSVYEHAVVSFYFDGISRNCGYEMLRHRPFSRSELSQRFVNMLGSTGHVVPPAMADEDTGVMSYAWQHARDAYGLIVDILSNERQGLSRKQVREAARSVLPGMTETRFVQTGNLRAWRHFLTMRGNIHADAEIRAVAVAVAGELVRMYPNAMADIEFYSEDGHACVRLKQSDAE